MESYSQLVEKYQEISSQKGTSNQLRKSPAVVSKESSTKYQHRPRSPNWYPLTTKTVLGEDAAYQPRDSKIQGSCAACAQPTHRAHDQYYPQRLWKALQIWRGRCSYCSRCLLQLLLRLNLMLPYLEGMYYLHC